MQQFGVEPLDRGSQQRLGRVQSALWLDARRLGAPVRRQIIAWRGAIERDGSLKRAARVVIGPLYASRLLDGDIEFGEFTCDELSRRLNSFVAPHRWRGATSADVAAWLNDGFSDLVARGFLTGLDGGYALTWPYDHELWNSEVRGYA